MVFISLPRVTPLVEGDIVDRVNKINVSIKKQNEQVLE